MAVITLTTDFGTRDTYVAEMKAAILSITRDVHVVDVSHEVAPHDVLEGALALEAVVPWFPPTTIHVAVVDPGVGTARRGLAVVSAGQIFVGPDNGIFTPFLGRTPWRAFEIRAEQLGTTAVSRTFHGRDVFAPAAARLALGLEPERLGPRVADPVLLAWPRARVVGGRLGGSVIHVDRFGNLVTSILGEALASLGSGLAVRVGSRTLPLVGTYGELARGRAGALVGSRNRLEIAVNRGSAAAVLRARRGTPVVVSRISSPAAATTRRQK